MPQQQPQTPAGSVRPLKEPLWVRVAETERFSKSCVLLVQLVNT